MSSLAEGICTKHYVYLIETGKRIPSVKIIDELSAKLNFDWRDYIEYANNASPIEAKRLIDQIEHYNNTHDIDKLCSLLNNLPDKPYLQCYPVYIEIWIQKIYIYICAEEKRIKDIKSVKESFGGYIAPLAAKEDFSSMPIVYLKSLNVYSALLIKEGHIDRALPICKKLISALEGKKHIVRYRFLYVDAYHNIIVLYRKKGSYKNMRHYGIMLMKYQESECLIDKLPLTLILLGDSYKGVRKYTMAFKYYKRSISVSKIIKKAFFTEIAEKRISKLY
jgi:hypothetical protein